MSAITKITGTNGTTDYVGSQVPGREAESSTATSRKFTLEYDYEDEYTGASSYINGFSAGQIFPYKQGNSNYIQPQNATWYAKGKTSSTDSIIYAAQYLNDGRANSGTAREIMFSGATNFRFVYNAAMPAVYEQDVNVEAAAGNALHYPWVTTQVAVNSGSSTATPSSVSLSIAKGTSNNNYSACTITYAGTSAYGKTGVAGATTAGYSPGIGSSSTFLVPVMVIGWDSNNRKIHLTRAYLENPSSTGTKFYGMATNVSQSSAESGYILVKILWRNLLYAC